MCTTPLSRCTTPAPHQGCRILRIRTMVLTWQRKHCWLNVDQAPAHRGLLHVAPGGSAAQTRPLLAAPVLCYYHRHHSHSRRPRTCLRDVYCRRRLSWTTCRTRRGSGGWPSPSGAPRSQSPHQLSFFAVATPNVVHVVAFSSSVGDFLGRVRIRSCACAFAYVYYILHARAVPVHRTCRQATEIELTDRHSSCGERVRPS